MSGTRTVFHNEGGTQTGPKVYKIQIRPTPWRTDSTSSQTKRPGIYPGVFAARRAVTPAADIQTQGGLTMNSGNPFCTSAALALGALAFALTASPPRPRGRKAAPSGNHPPPELRQERVHAFSPAIKDTDTSSGMRRRLSVSVITSIRHWRDAPRVVVTTRMSAHG